MNIKELNDKIKFVEDAQIGTNLNNMGAVQTGTLLTSDNCPLCKSDQIATTSTDDGRVKMVCNSCANEWFSNEVGGRSNTSGTNANLIESTDSMHNTLTKHGWKKENDWYTHPDHKGHKIGISGGKFPGVYHYHNLDTGARVLTPHTFVSSDKLDSHLQKMRKNDKTT